MHCSSLGVTAALASPFSLGVFYPAVADPNLSRLAYVAPPARHHLPAQTWRLSGCGVVGRGLASDTLASTPSRACQVA